MQRIEFVSAQKLRLVHDRHWQTEIELKHLQHVLILARGVREFWWLQAEQEQIVFPKDGEQEQELRDWLYGLVGFNNNALFQWENKSPMSGDQTLIWRKPGMNYNQLAAASKM